MAARAQMLLCTVLAATLLCSLPAFATSVDSNAGLKPRLNEGIDYAAMASLLSGGSDPGRKLLQATADAISFKDEVTAGPTKYCNTYTDANIPDTCPSQAPYPSCCGPDICYSNSDGSTGSCNSKDAPNRACCPAFNQKAGVCPPPDSSSTCSDKKRPVPACCGTDTCAVNKNAAGGDCPSDSKTGCCPA